MQTYLINELKGHKGEITQMEFSPDDALVLTSSTERHGTDQSLRLWDVKSGKELAKVPAGKSGISTFVPLWKENRAVIMADQAVNKERVFNGAPIEEVELRSPRLIDFFLGSKPERIEIQSNPVRVRSVFPLSDTKFLAHTLPAFPAIEKRELFSEVFEYDRVTKEKRSVFWTKKEPRNLVFSNDGKFFAFHSVRSNKIFIHSTEDGSKVDQVAVEIDAIGDIALTEKYLVSSNIENIEITPLAKDQRKNRRVIEAQSYPTGLIANKSGTLFATLHGWREELGYPLQDLRARIWDIESGQMISGTFNNMTFELSKFSFSPSGKLVGAGNKYGGVYLYSLG